MGYSVDWLIENEIIYVKFWGKGTEDELRQALVEVTHMREISPRDYLHTITNTHGVTTPIRFQDSMKVIREFEATKDNGWEIVIGKVDRILKLSLSISRSILRNKSINFLTIDEAFEHLKKEDKTINWNRLNHAILEEKSNPIS